MGVKVYPLWRNQEDPILKGKKKKERLKAFLFGNAILPR